MPTCRKKDRIPAARRGWLVKSEPASFSWADLLASPNRTTVWDGVRNYQARNFLRDELAVGDLVFFYQSCTRPLGVVGEMRVVRAGYPDPTQFLPDHPGFDATSSKREPRWFAVDVQATRTYPAVVHLELLRRIEACQGMPLLQRASRLSVQPVPPPAVSALIALGDGAHGEPGATH